MNITPTLIILNPVNENNNNTHFFSWLKSNYNSDKQKCIYKYMKQYNTSIQNIEVLNRLNDIYNNYLNNMTEQKNQLMINDIFNNRNLSEQVLKLNQDNDLYENDHFYQWLLSGNYDDNRMNCKINYLISEFDFIIGFNSINEKTINSLQYIYDHYYNSIERYKLKNINNLIELIIIKERFDTVRECQKASIKIQVNNEAGFINGDIMTRPHNKLFTFEITDKLKNCLNDCFSDFLDLSGYLQLTVRSDKTLLLTYQYDHIIGSIYIAKIEQDIPDFLLNGVE